ncbi:MAG: chemotaxis protein CheA [Burkholderiales bacterium]
MSHFQGMEELLQDFLTEAGELLSDVDSKLMELEQRPNDKELLNTIFRGFHTIKGGAGFLNVTDLVNLCHLTENLFDKLRNSELSLNAELMDVIMSATGCVSEMFGPLRSSQLPAPADPALIAALKAALDGQPAAPQTAPQAAPAAQPAPPVVAAAPKASTPDASGIDWQHWQNTLLGKPSPASAPAAPATPANPTAPAAEAAAAPARSPGRRATDQPDGDGARTGRRENDKVAVAAAESTIRVDTVRLDQVLNLSGEIGLAKNRLNCLRTDMLQGKRDPETLRELDLAVSRLDLLVSDLQNAVMKTRMQPIGRLFQKYPRMARDLSRQLGKNIEVALEGEETELDKTMIEDLGDPLIHLVRNAVDHGIELPADRVAQGKPEKSILRLTAQQIGDSIIIEISDDGRGMRPDIIRKKAVEKGCITADAAANLNEDESLKLILLPGFSTKDTVSDVSGRGVGMDVVKTKIQKLNGRIEIKSVVGQGSTFTIYLPLTLAILPVLVVRCGEQPFAVPLALVREIIPIHAEDVQAISGKATMVIRDEILPVFSLASLIGWPRTGAPAYGVLMQSAVRSFILAVDSFVGRDDVVIKPLEDIKPRGVAGATQSGDGSVVLVLDMEELLREMASESRGDLLRQAA